MIIGVTGRIGSGKGEVVKFFLKKNFIYFTLSQILREELEKQGVEITRKNLQDIGDLLRSKEGPGALIKRLLNKLEPGKNYIIDGIRNPGEIEVLRKLINFYLISVDSSQKQRFIRVLGRAKESDPKTIEDFILIDERDFCDKENPFGQQVGKCMEQADFHIINDRTKKELILNLEKIWDKIKLLKK
jgi:dephospho-CoA kinase